jgi:hypothetical protein
MVPTSATVITSLASSVRFIGSGFGRTAPDSSVAAVAQESQSEDHHQADGKKEPDEHHGPPRVSRISTSTSCASEDSNLEPTD